MDNWDSTLYEDRHSFVWKKSADLVETILEPKAGERIYVELQKVKFFSDDYSI